MRLVATFGIVIIFLSGCIKQTSLNYRPAKPLLVVEGLLLSDDSTPCEVTLSFSGLFNKVGYQTQDFINDATVFVKNDDTGDSTKLVSEGSGVYRSQGSIGAKAGSSYSISIALADGRRYASFPEKIAPVSKTLALDSIDISVPVDFPDLFGAAIKVRTQDPGGERNYYRWTSIDHLARKATGVPCGINSPPCFVYCNQLYHDPNVYILSDANLNGAEIRYQTALVSPYFWFGSHYVQINQLSLTERAYEFWNLYGGQTTRTGGILDPLPAPIQGNIYNTGDSTELALGYFEASDVTSIKLILSPIMENQYYTLLNAGKYIKEGACYVVYPNALNDAPPGWEGATQYIYNVY